MVTIVKSMAELKFSQLMQVYAESNAMNGAERYPNESTEIQLMKAEMDFYHYLKTIFFRQEDSFYAILDTECGYMTALRLEPYSDGYLLCALETAPAARRKGMAHALITGVQDFLCDQASGIIYSHVSKRNTASLLVHQKCGFQIIKDYATYSDGSVLQNSYTLAYKYEKTEIS